MIDFSQKNLLVLAPLAGYTDLPFRNVVKKFGVDLTISEMISSNALAFKNERTLKMVEKSALETPYVVQIAANDPAIAIEAVKVLNDIEGIDGIDLNCGCPAKKITLNGAGSSLLTDMPKMSKIIESIKNTSNKKYMSVKFRLGFDEKIPKTIAKTCEESGADYIAIHGRTRAGAYKAKVDYEAIAAAKESVKIPVIANGDIVDLQSADNVKRLTNCDGLMIGRGAIGKPWIFYQLKHKLNDISSDIKKEIIIEHYNSMIEFYGNHGVSMFRKHLHTYSKGQSGASSFRDEINTITDVEKMGNIIKHFF